MKSILQALKVVLLAVVLSFGVSYVYAWNVPTATPPNANVSAPINTGSSYQIKTGWLKIIGGNSDGYSHIGLGNNWWMSENPNGWYALRQFGIGDRITVNTNGNVGIGTGTDSAASKLSVNGGVQVGADGAACVAAKAGTMRWSGGKIEICTGSIWKVVDGT